MPRCRIKSMSVMTIQSNHSVWHCLYSIKNKKGKKLIKREAFYWVKPSKYSKQCKSTWYFCIKDNTQHPTPSTSTVTIDTDRSTQHGRPHLWCQMEASRSTDIAYSTSLKLPPHLPWPQKQIFVFEVHYRHCLDNSALLARVIMDNNFFIILE